MGRRIVGGDRQLKGNITFSRPSGGDDDMVSIRVDDESSGLGFLEVRVSLSSFTMALMGLAHTKCNLTVNGLEHVGKVREYEPAKVFISDAEYSLVTTVKRVADSLAYERGKEQLVEWLKTTQAREGWEVDAYLGSQGSITYADKGKWLNFGYFRYVQK